MAFELNPNILDRYTQYGYHFRMFMVSEPDALQRKVPGPDQIPEDNIIAETGGSSKNACSIEDVSITSYGGIDKETSLGISADFNIQIVQSLGATLIDSIYETAKTLGIKNVARIPFFLELTFRVRHENSQEPLGWQPLSGYRWVWPLILTNTRMRVTSSGSTYNFRAALFDTIALYREISDLNYSVEISASTVGEFFKKLSEVVTKPRGDREKNVYNDKTEFVFQVAEEIIAEEIIGQTDTQTKDQQGERSQWVEGEQSLSFSKGTSFDSIIFDVLTGTKLFQKEIASNRTHDESNDAKATQDTAQGVDKKKLFTRLFRVVQSVELIGWNEQLRDYDKRYIYEIVFYESSTHLSSTADADLIRASLSNYIDRGVLKKAYNYQFTGLNNAVINFDFNLNFNWYLALPLQGGETFVNKRADRPAQESDGEPLSSLMTDDEPNNDNEFPIAGKPSDAPFITNTNSLETTGRNMVSVLFEQQVSPTSGDLINVDLEIRGDPFWLEPDPLPAAGVAPNYRDRATRKPTDFFNNSTGTQTFFIFTMYLPQEVDPNTGLVPPQSSKNIINGIYSVRKAVHKFSKGKFTQTLTAVRDPHLNINSLQDGRVIQRIPTS
jgi:hypothetical protein